MTDQLPLFGDRGSGIEDRKSDDTRSPIPDSRSPDPDTAAREFARDPDHNVVLEASAGTGKTTVLVTRYVNLLARGVDPANILAITFTRKAAAEMRERILRDLRRAAGQSTFDRARWTAIRDRLADIQISTIDAFCLSLLREFPLEADLDPGFGMADETEVPRLVDQSLDTSLAIFIGLAKREPDLALVLAQLGLTRTREGLAYLLHRRLVAWDVLDRFLARGPAGLDADAVCRRAIDSLIDLFAGVAGGLETFLAEGPVHQPRYRLLAQDLRRLESFRTAGNATVRGLLNRVERHVLKADGKPRTSDRIHPYKNEDYPNAEAGKRHRVEALRLGTPVENILRRFSRDLNVVLAGGIRKMFAIALAQYKKALNDRSLLDFSDVLQHAVDLLGRMDEFSQSRYRLEGRYHHVLVDEFQDTSRKQWELVSLLVKAWGEGMGLATQPSIFIVGDRKQSIYRFRDADVSVLKEAGVFIDALRPGSTSRRSIARSFRAVPELLAFVNDLFGEMGQHARRPDDFKYDADDRFPVDSTVASPKLGSGSGAEAARFPVDEARTESASPLVAPKPASAGEGGKLRSSEGGTLPAESPVASPKLGSESGRAKAGGPALGVITGADSDECAAAVAAEIGRILREETVRDKQTGVARAATAGDIGILFRSRASHREFESALEAAGIPAYVYKGLGFFDADEIKDLSALIRFLANPSSDLRAAAFLRSRFVRLSDTALSALARVREGAPAGQARVREDASAGHAGLAAALTSPDPPAALATLPDDDRAALELARRYVPAWLARVDRVPPADLIEQLIPDSAYAYELRGVRRDQAWENVKKMRGLVRRIQNRGYATLARIADHLDSLTAGDESNAVLEALDAVNLMTVHASKGLEFPIVFVVNLAKGASGFPKPVRVSGEEVSVGPFVSESDDEERFREREETKRLMYVALTRARDRLYVGTVLKDGAFAIGRGSLGDVLPESFRGLFVRAAQEPGDTIAWTAQSGRAYRFNVCRDLPAKAGSHEISSEIPEISPEIPEISQETLVASGFSRKKPPVDAFAPLTDPEAITRVTVAAPVPDWTAIAAHPDVALLLESGEWIRQLEFSYVGEPGRVIRGTIDCLVRRPDGSIVVLAARSGAPSPGDPAQLDLYVRAARAMFPGASVAGQVIYTD